MHFVTRGKIGKVWGMIRKMNGIKREYGYPILSNGEITAVKGEEKAEMLAKTFVTIHNLDNISEKGRIGWETTIAENEELLEQEEDINDLLNKPFIKIELNRSLNKTKMSAPGKDQICYIMLKHLSESAKEILLKLFNKVWEGGKLPLSWKEAVVIPIGKPRKDLTNPGNYRPIALTSNMCKIMGKMVDERLTYYEESKGYLCKSGFRKSL